MFAETSLRKKLSMILLGKIVDVVFALSTAILDADTSYRLSQLLLGRVIVKNPIKAISIFTVCGHTLY